MSILNSLLVLNELNHYWAIVTRIALKNKLEWKNSKRCLVQVESRKISAFDKLLFGQEFNNVSIESKLNPKFGTEQISV